MEEILETIKTIVNSILSWVSTFWNTIKSVITDTLELLFSVIGWVLYCVFDGLLAVIYAVVNGLDLSVVAFDMASEWSSMPEQLVWLVKELGIPQCLTVISGALTLRLLLNILPAALTRI